MCIVYTFKLYPHCQVVYELAIAAIAAKRPAVCARAASAIILFPRRICLTSTDPALVHVQSTRAQSEFVSPAVTRRINLLTVTFVYSEEFKITSIPCWSLRPNPLLRCALIFSEKSSFVNRRII